MNVSDVVTRVKRIFGDEANVQITDEDIIRWINDAQIKIAIDNEGLLETTVTTDAIQNQMDYDFPSDVSVLRNLTFKGFRLKYMSLSEFNEYIDGYKSPPGVGPYGAGIPEIFTTWANKVTIFPKPQESVTNGLAIFYMRQPTAVVNPADELGVPLQYHPSVENYCLSKAYELDEDMEKAAYNKGKYDEDMNKLNQRNKMVQEYYPRITTLPEDENYGTYGYWGGYY